MTTVEQVAPVDPAAAAAPMPIASRLFGAIAVGVALLSATATFLVLEERLSLVLESWPLVIGTIFSAFVLFLPKGIWGTLTGGIHGRQSA